MQICQNYFLQKNTKQQLDKILQNIALTKSALLIYWVVLTFLLLKPADIQEETWYMFDGVDKIIHVSIFALLSFLFMIAFPRIKFIFFLQIMLLYAFVTEILQETMQLGRSLEILDIVADLIGICIGFYLYKILLKILA